MNDFILGALAMYLACALWFWACGCECGGRE